MKPNLSIELNPEKLIQNIEEYKRFLTAICAMEYYSYEALKYPDKMESDYDKIDKKYTSKLSFDFKGRITRLRKSIGINQDLLNNMLKIYKPSEEFYKDIDIEEIEIRRFEEGNFILNVFTYIERDWSNERTKERKETYDIIINELIKFFPHNCPEANNYKILIPGAALNRLGYELCKYGYDIETNDYLFLNGIFSDFIFNKMKKKEYSVFPNIDSFSNYLEEEANFKSYLFPDCDINLNKDKNSNIGKIHMSIGDFQTLYNNKSNYFDCVITCYFIDTGQNVIKYIDIIHNILKQGGIWINLGPLSYHWANDSNNLSIELPYDKLKEVICNYGFEFINESFKNLTFGYVEGNMHNDLFKCIFFTTKKIN